MLSTSVAAAMLSTSVVAEQNSFNIIYTSSKWKGSLKTKKLNYSAIDIQLTALNGKDLFRKKNAIILP